MARYQRAVSTWSAYAPAYYNIGVIHSERRNFAAAKEMYELAIQCHPSYPEAHCNLGVIHKEEGRLEEAIASYDRALAISPEFSIVANNLAIALTEMGTRVKVAGELLSAQVHECWLNAILARHSGICVRKCTIKLSLYLGLVAAQPCCRCQGTSAAMCLNGV